MLKNYLLVAVRNILRNPAISFIHITGFGLGLAAFMFTMQAVVSEFSFDSFHKNGDRIYKINAEYVWPGSHRNINAGEIEPALAPLLKSAIPEVTHAARYISQLMEEPYCVVTYTDENGKKKSFNELNARYVDEDFLKIFQFKIIQGSQTPLMNSTGIVMTRSCALRYFGNENPIGKIVELTTGGTESIKTKFNYQVETVLEDIPWNSSLQFDMLLPFRAFEDNFKMDVSTNWWWHGGFYTFIQTQSNNIDVSALESKIYETVPENIRDNWIITSVETVKYRVEKLSDIHLSTYGRRAYADAGSPVKVSDKAFLFILMLIGVAILIIAEMNYISLTTAKALKRVKEVSIRKIVGATRKQLAIQFLVDAWCHVIIGLAFAFTLLQVTKTNLALWLKVSINETSSWNYLSVIFVVLFITTVTVMGVVPAYFLSFIRSVSVLKGKVSSVRGRVLRKSLVIFQFTASFVLICMTYVIISQLTFMRSKDTGISMDQRIAIRAIGTEDFDFKKFRQFKARTENTKNVLSTTAGMSIPGYYSGGGTAPWSTPTKSDELGLLDLAHVSVDFDYIKTLNIPLVVGRDFTEDRVTDERTCLINETALAHIGFGTPNEAMGKSLYFHWKGEQIEVKIIGVVADGHFDSPGTRPDPVVFTFANTVYPHPKYRHYVMHVAGEKINETIGDVKKVWQEVFQDAPFEYFFLDEGFQRVFEREERMQAVATVSTVLAIFIACMGLAGLVAYAMTQRIKEIGIRKTLGASVTRLLIMLSGVFVKPILISMVLALPVTWAAINMFLENYENRIEVSVMMFVIPCIALLIIAVATMSVQTVMAAKSNPVDALKHE